MSKVGYKIGLLGQPNSGKTTLFNSLTGMHQHVGNWPGKTVELKIGKFNIKNNTYTITDLPGIYSLSARSEEEKITRDYLIGDDHDMIIIIIDSSQIERSLFILADFIGIDTPVIVVCNMIDVAKEKGKEIDFKKIEEILGVGVVPMIASEKQGLDLLLEKVDQQYKSKLLIKKTDFIKKYSDLPENDFSSIKKHIQEVKIGNCSKEWISIKLLENDGEVKKRVNEQILVENKEEINTFMEGNNNQLLLSANVKFDWINDLLKETVKSKHEKYTISKFDKIATHKVFGIPLAIILLLSSLLLSFLVVMPFFMVVIQLVSVINGVLDSLNTVGIPNFLVSLVSCAIFPGLIITLLFAVSVLVFSFFIGILEDIGYLARVAYLFDHSMSKLGIQGKSVMPIMMSLGCNISGIVSSRTIASWRQRTLTIIISLVVPCGAMWGVIGLVSALFFGTNAIWIILILFITMFAHMKMTSKIFGRNLPSEKETGLIMELPPYHKPNFKSISLFVWSRVKDVFKKTFKLIMFVTILMWFLSYSVDGMIEHSIIYAIGKFIEPFGLIFGLDWRLFIAFIFSGMGKEASLGVIAILFNVGTGASSMTSSLIGSVTYDTNALSAVMLSTVSVPQALAFIFAFFFNIPCLGAVATVNLETHSVKWTLITVIYYMGSALVIGGIVFQIASIFF